MLNHGIRMLEQQVINSLILSGIYRLVAVAFLLTTGLSNFLGFSIPGVGKPI